MNTRSRIFLIAVGVVILVGGIFAFLWLSKLKSPVDNPVDLLPESSFLIINSNKPSTLWDQLNQGNLVWAALNETQWASSVNDRISMLDSIVASDPSVNDLLDETECWISLVKTKISAPDIFVAASFSTVAQAEEVMTFAGKQLHHVQENIRNGFTVLISDELTMSAVNGVVLFSNNTELINAAIDQRKNGNSLLQDKAFSRVMQTSGEHSSARFFLRNDGIANALKSLCSENSPVPGVISESGVWTEFDLALHSNSASLNGYMSSGDSSSGWIRNFSGQSSQTMENDRFLPASTAAYCSFSLSSFQSFLETRTGNTGEKDENVLRLARLKEEHFDPEDAIGSWIGNEFTMAKVAIPGEGLRTFAVMSAASIDVARQKLGLISIDTGGAVADSSLAPVRKISLNGILPAVFGNIFGDLIEISFTTFDDRVVFGENENVLRAYTAYLHSRVTLARNAAYADFRNNMEEDANITAYIAPGNAISILKKNANDLFSKGLNEHEEMIRRFDGACCQVSDAGTGLYYTSVFVRHNPQEKKSLATLWETELDTTFSGKPWLVRDHKTKGLDVFVQDDGNTVYLISGTGTIFWKRKLDGKIIGDVSQVDALKNDKYQLAFNTANKLYIIDRNGKDLEHFPVKFPAQATNPVYVLDYDNNREYRFLVACADKKVYDYNINGGKVDGWKTYSTGDIISSQLKRIITGNKDYVIAVDRSGRTYFTDRQGNTRIQLKQKLPAGTEAFFIENGKVPSNTWLVASDSLGNIFRLSMTDQLERLHFTEFTEKPAFGYKDVNGDGSVEYVFVSSGHLLVYNKERKPLIDHAFAQGCTPELEFITIDKSDIRIACVSPSSSTLHLINKGGEESPGFPMAGQTMFAAGRLNSGDGYTLISGNNGRFVEALPMP